MISLLSDRFPHLLIGIKVAKSGHSEKMPRARGFSRALLIFRQLFRIKTGAGVGVNRIQSK